MRKFPFLLFVCALVVATCSCSKSDPQNGTEEPEVPELKLDSYNGQFVQEIANAYDVFESTGSLPSLVNVEGLTYNKGKYILAACMLIEKIDADPEHWQDEDIELLPVTFGDEYRWNTFDPDVIDIGHVRFMAGRLLSFTRERGQLPNLRHTAENKLT